MGRPTKCTSDLITKVSAAVAQGCTIEAACAAAGISTSTFREWRVQGKKGAAPYSAFLAAVKKAEASAEERLLGIINEAAPKTWQAAAWILERRFPKRWARRTLPPFRIESHASAPILRVSPTDPLKMEDGRRIDDLADEELVALCRGDAHGNLREFQ